MSSSGASSLSATASSGLSQGDRVVSGAAVSCGHCLWCLPLSDKSLPEYLTLGLQVNGGLAELVKSPAAVCRQVPDGCADDAAAMAQPLAVALHALLRVGQGPGSRSR